MYIFKDSCSFPNRGLLLHELAESRWKKKSYNFIISDLITLIDEWNQELCEVW